MSKDNETTPALQAYIQSLQSNQRNYISEQIEKEKKVEAPRQENGPLSLLKLADIYGQKQKPSFVSHANQAAAAMAGNGDKEDDGLADSFVFNIKPRRKK